MNREILDAIEEQTDLRYDSLADAAGRDNDRLAGGFYRELEFNRPKTGR